MAEEDRATTSSIKIPSWDGTEGEKAQMHVAKLESVAELGGCAEALEMSFESALPTSETQTTQTEDEKKAVKLNKKARAVIVQGVCGTKGMEYIREGKTNEYPKGIACRMYKAIKDKIQKQDAVTPVEIEGDIAAISMRQDDNPKVLFDQISTIKFKYERDDDPSIIVLKTCCML